MKITWLGHASFLIETADGTRVVTDPFEAGSYGGAVGYAPIEERADLVTVSHEHPDHLDPDTLPHLLRNNPACRFAAPAALPSQAGPTSTVL